MHWCDPDLFRCVCRAGPTGRASSTLMACLRFEDAANAFQLIVVLFFTSLICLRECGAGGDGPLRSKTQPSFPSFCRRVAGCTGLSAGGRGHCFPSPRRNQSRYTAIIVAQIWVRTKNDRSCSVHCFCNVIPDDASPVSRARDCDMGGQP